MRFGQPGERVLVAGEAAAEFQGKVGAGSGLDPVWPPPAELRVQITSLRQVGSVKFQMDDRVGAKRFHRPLDCDQLPPAPSSAGTGLTGMESSVRERPGRARATVAPSAENAARTPSAGANPSRKASGEAKLPAPAKTAADTATPKTPPSSRIMLLAPAALPTSSRENAPTTEFCAAGIAIDTPTPATIDGIRNSE